MLIVFLHIIINIEDNQENIDRVVREDKRKTIISVLAWIVSIIVTILCTYFTIR